MEDSSWPQEGNELFTSDGDYYDHAHFGWGNWDVTFAGYCMGYKESADTLIEEAISSKIIRKLDTYIFPVLFLYKQYLELQMKYIYLKYSEDSKKKKQKVIGKCSHNLMKIWNIIKPIMNEFASTKDNKTTNIVEKYIQQYHELDEGSFRFRYPIDIKLNEILGDDERINYINLKERMNELKSFFTGVEGHLESVKDYKNEMESNNV